MLQPAESGQLLAKGASVLKPFQVQSLDQMVQMYTIDFQVLRCAQVWKTGDCDNGGTRINVLGRCVHRGEKCLITRGAGV